MSDLIQHQDCRITITHGLDSEGDMLFSVHVDGDMPYVSTLGLLEAAKDHLKQMFEEEE